MGAVWHSRSLSSLHGITFLAFLALRSLTLRHQGTSSQLEWVVIRHASQFSLDFQVVLHDSGTSSFNGEKGVFAARVEDEGASRQSQIRLLLHSLWTEIDY